MKAVALTRYLPIDDPDSLVDVVLPDPVPGPRDLLVEVRAIAVNPVDCKVRAPKPQVESAAPRVLGWDAAGVVKRVGAAVANFREGDEVYYAGNIARPGCNSELHLVDERIVARKAKSLSFAEAAALPLTALTAWEALFDRLKLAPDGRNAKTVLVFAGAGGLGSIAIQLAKKVAGLRVFATASRSESAAWARQMGADAVIDHAKPLAPQLEEHGVKAVDIVLALRDTDETLPGLPAIVAPQGSVVLFNSAAKPHDLQPFMQKSVTITWELMFTRSLFETEDMGEQGRILERVAALVDAGTLGTTLNANLGTINAANLREAHGRLESGRTIGKIVLEGF